MDAVENDSGFLYTYSRELLHIGWMRHVGFMIFLTSSEEPRKGGNTAICDFLRKCSMMDSQKSRINGTTYGTRFYVYLHILSFVYTEESSLII